MISLRAHAKLNVTLEVLGRRADGYHDVAIVMQTLELHDVVSVRATDGDAITFSSTSSEIHPVDNLCVTAAHAARELAGIRSGVHIELDKRIPIAAGLGGGSSDAAAVLLALRRLWGASIADGDLLEAAARIGSDVPFFLFGGLALCEGRGERVTPLPGRWPASMRWLLLAKPAIGVPTRDAYQGLPETAFTDGAHTRALRRRLEQGGGVELSDVKNAFEPSVFDRWPDVARTRDALLAAGAPRAFLCGTGATVVGPFETLEDAERVRTRLPDLTTLLTRAWSP